MTFFTGAAVILRSTINHTVSAVTRLHHFQGSFLERAMSFDTHKPSHYSFINALL